MPQTGLPTVIGSQNRNGGFAMKIMGSTDGRSINAARIQGLNAASQDGIVKAIEKQISNLQKQMNSLSSNQAMSRNEKELAKKELEKNLQSLNDQLSRRREDIKAKLGGGNEDTDDQDTASKLTIEEDFLQGVLNTDRSIKRVSAARVAMMKMKARVRSLETEIRMDSSRGVPTARKEEMLTSIKSKMLDISSKLNDSTKKTEDVRGLYRLPGRDDDKKERDQVIIRLETRVPLKVTKIWHQKNGRLINIRL